MEDTDHLLPRDSASYTSTSLNLAPRTTLNQASKVGQNRSNKCNVCLRLVDFLLNGLLFTTISIGYWAGTWDILSLYIVPSNLVISYISSLLIANVILLVAYLFQEEFQNWHNRWYFGTQLPESYGNVQDSGENESTVSYYNFRAFVFRCFYTYLVAFAYVAQWRTYWDLLDLITVDVSYWYFLAIALFALVLHRTVLNGSLETYAKTVPFALMRDQHLDSYFIQLRKIYSENKRLENFYNFLYYEFVEMMISVFIWKGFWDLLEKGLSSLLISYFNDVRLVSILASGVIGYALYIILILHEVLINKLKCSCIKLIYLKDFVYMVSFLSVVAVWRFLWDGFDYLVIGTPYDFYLILGTHFSSFLVLFVLQVGTIIYGPGGLSSSNDSNEQCSVREYFQSNSEIKFYDIEYFSFQNG